MAFGVVDTTMGSATTPMPIKHMKFQVGDIVKSIGDGEETGYFVGLATVMGYRADDSEFELEVLRHDGQIGGGRAYQGRPLWRCIEASLELVKQAKKVSQKTLDKQLIKKRNTFLKQYRVEFMRVRKHELVDRLDILTGERLVVRTKMLYLTSRWFRSKKEIGQYEIFLDCLRDEVLMINITKNSHLGEYDGPCIKNTHPCFGNIYDDIFNELNKKQFSELVTDCIDFAMTPNVEDGYISWGGFFERAKLLPKGYSYKKRLTDLGETHFLTPILGGLPQSQLSVNILQSVLSSDVSDLYPSSLLQAQQRQLEERRRDNIRRFSDLVISEVSSVATTGDTNYESDIAD